ncbi:MAG: molybdopterin-dependent oxidoreductase [Acidobacteriota bacterium]|nr:molybdopterin-dependent oxidoreductase [Acidobacteriota bacterium]
MTDTSLHDRPVLKIVGDSGAHHQPRPLATAEEWRLKVSGAVERPGSFDLGDLGRLATEDRPVPITCVSAAKITPDGRPVVFRGTPFAAVAREVGVESQGGEGGSVSTDTLELSGVTVQLISRAPATLGSRSERHHTFMSLEDCLDPQQGLLLAIHLDGEPLPYPNGGPLRAAFGPAFFFYKSIKWLEEIRLVRQPLEDSRGTWEEYAGYHVRARVAQGERFEPRMHRILAAEEGSDGLISDTLELVPRERWQEVFEECWRRRDFSRLSAAQLHKMFGPLPKSFVGCRFHDGPFRAKLRGTSFASTDFTGVDLAGCNFSLTKFTNARFSREGADPADLSCCDFEGAYFNNAHLQGVSMAGASLSNATFFGPRDFDKPTDRVRGLDVREALQLEPRTAQWLERNGALVS